jgi:adenosylcobinamide kinase / adenosylcobinamide-phosphate guanylyltransferase
MSLILIGGGARSGKSRYALQVARQCGPRVAFIATAVPGDDEMRARIALHQRERGPEFTTFEEPLAIASLIDAKAAQFDALVVDCLTLWLSNQMFAAPAELETTCRQLMEAAARVTAAVVMVTNEVGCGIVPENELAREFRDRAGKLNQEAAQRADAVYWMAFGIPLKVK